MNRWYVWLILGNAVVGGWLLGFVQETDLKIRILAFLVPLDVGLIGMFMGIDSRRISKERHNNINEYERPHIVYTLELLFNDVAETTRRIENSKDSTHMPEDLKDYAYERTQWHMGTIRLLGLQFLDSGLSRHHMELDHSLIELGRISFPENTDGANEMIARLETIMDSIVQVIKEIKAMPRL